MTPANHPSVVQHKPTRLDDLRGQVGMMTSVAWAEHGRALNYAMWARQAEHEACLPKYRRWKQMAEDHRRRAKQYVQWAKRKRAEVEHFEEVMQAANDA